MSSHRSRHTHSPAPSAEMSRPETEIEDDGDIDMDRTKDNESIPSDVASTAYLSSERRNTFTRDVEVGQ